MSGSLLQSQQEEPADIKAERAQGAFQVLNITRQTFPPSVFNFDIEIYITAESYLQKLFV